jgi:uncharacterized cupredoxin-like copper-binding protein
MALRPAAPAALLAAAAAVSVAGCGSSSSDDKSASSSSSKSTPPAASSTGPLTATETEFKIASPPSAKGPKVTWTVKNAGKIPHEFVVLRTKKKAGSLGKGQEVPEPGNVGEVSGIAPGKTKKLSLKLKPGHYALICNLPGHYKGGMFADFTVK